MEIVTRRHRDDNLRQFIHPQYSTTVGSFLENFLSLSTRPRQLKQKKDLAQDQNIPTAIFEVFKNQNMTLSSVSILNGIVFFCNLKRIT